MSAVRLARPNFPAGSAETPVRIASSRWTVGTLCTPMIQTCRPLDSVRFSIGGSVSDGAGPTAGGFERSGACCAGSAHTTSTHEASTLNTGTDNDDHVYRRVISWA